MKDNHHDLSAFDYLGALFIFMKMLGAIDWSWWWVLLPIYGHYGGVLVWITVPFIMQKLRRKNV